MVTCRDIVNLKLDGVELVAGESGLNRVVSWVYLVQTKPYKDHMNQGNFAVIGEYLIAAFLNLKWAFFNKCWMLMGEGEIVG